MHWGIKMKFWKTLRDQLISKIERQCKFNVKLNDYLTNLINIKSENSIRFLISEFDLIMGPIKI
jgi:hypothetical protein